MILGFDPEKARKDFPMLSKPIIYFDNACMSLKPKQVIDKMNEYYNDYTACAGRSSHSFAKKVEDEIAKSREAVRSHINAKSDSEIVFTRNTTEGINIVANGLEFKNGDEIIITDKEHNSNLIPWLRLRKKGVKVIVAHTNDDGTFNIENFKRAITKKTRLVSVVYTSNVDGITNPIKDIVKIAHENKSLTLVDAAQAAPGKRIDVKDLDVDFLAFSGHKMLGPTGTGVLYGKKSLLEQLDQFIVGGETVKDSTYEGYIEEDVPMKFEAGLQDYAGIIGLGEACRYLKNTGIGKIEAHEIKLNKIITDILIANEKISILGPKNPEKRSGIFSFNIKGINPHEAAKMLESSKKIMVRSGFHCAHSWFNKRKIEGSIRASVYFYNTEKEAEIFAEEVKKITKIT
ncbi:MAG: cysteine desulfurase [Nanoarchaeota archaeon]